MNVKGKAHHGPSVDVFSFAITCYQVTTGNVSFRETNHVAVLYETMQGGNRPAIPPAVLSDLRGPMGDCWHEAQRDDLHSSNLKSDCGPSKRS